MLPLVRGTAFARPAMLAMCWSGWTGRTEGLSAEASNVSPADKAATAMAVAVGERVDVSKGVDVWVGRVVAVGVRVGVAVG